MDHAIMRDKHACPGIKGYNDLLCGVDIGTGLKYAFPVIDKSYPVTVKELRKIGGDGLTRCHRFRSILSDNWRSFKAATEKLEAVWKPSQEGHHNSNAFAERNVQDIVHATRKLLDQAGLPACLWPLAAPCYCFNSNTEVLAENGSSRYFMRYGEEPKHCKRLPFGCGVWFKPHSESGFTRKKHKAEPNSVYGIFVGYKLHPGGKFSG